MGMEKAISALTFGLAGGNRVYESSGIIASLLGSSFEVFAMDDEMPSHVHRTIRGIEVTDENLGFKSTQATVARSGHFIDAPETMVSMERDYYYPKLADRDEPIVWQEAGAMEHWQRAEVKVEQLLQQHRSYLDLEIRQQYPILLEWVETQPHLAQLHLAVFPKLKAR